MPKPRAKTTDRGLGHDHRKRRAQLPPANGQPCPYCRQPMWSTQRLDADHTRARAVGGTDSPLRWAHASCNRRAGQRLGMKLRTQHSAPIRTDLTW
jgi:hypothetical protein